MVRRIAVLGFGIALFAGLSATQAASATAAPAPTVTTVTVVIPILENGDYLHPEDDTL